MPEDFSISRVSRDEWYPLARQFQDYNYRHLWDFNAACGELQSTAVEYIKVQSQETVLGLASLRIKKLPVLGAGIAYIGGGPLTRKGPSLDLEVLQQCLQSIKQEYANKRKLLLRISPPLVQLEDRQKVVAVYEELGCKRAKQLPEDRTILLDIRPPLETLRANFNSRWRRQLKKAEKNEFQITTGSSQELFQEFCDLYKSFINWKDFNVNLDANFHLRMHADIPEQDRYMISIARHAGEVVGGHIAGVNGDTAVYIFGASHPQMRDLRIGHFMHWDVMQKLKQRNIPWYDLGGIDPDDNPGVYEFKKGMGGVDLSAPGPFECDAAPMRNKALAVAERTYRFLQRHKRD